MKQRPRETPDARGLRVAIVGSSFNRTIVDGLALGARQALEGAGAAASDLVELAVPGALELPLGARAAALSGRFDAVVALGAVIKGDTDHYEHVSRAATDGLVRVSLDTGVPVGMGVLTVREEEQARVRAAPGAGNKGAEAARAAVAMVHLLRSLEGGKAARRPRTVTTSAVDRARRGDPRIRRSARGRAKR